MLKKILLLSLMLVLVVGSLFAVVPESWVSTSLVFDWPKNPAMNPSSGSNESLGFDFSWVAFPEESKIGFDAHFALSFPVDATPFFSSMYLFIGPAYAANLTKGIVGYVAVGPSFIRNRYASSPVAREWQLGLALDLGARFKVIGTEQWDFALVAGAHGDITLLHLINGSQSTGSSSRVTAYLGLSFSTTYAFSRKGPRIPILFL